MKLMHAFVVLISLSGYAAAQDRIDSVAKNLRDENCVVQGSNNTVNCYDNPDIEKFLALQEAGQKAAEARARSDQMTAEVKLMEFEWVSKLIASWKEKYEQEQVENAKNAERIAKLEDGLAKSLLVKANALKKNNIKAAKRTYMQVVETSEDTVEAVAEARYQLGLIAETELSGLVEAAEQFEIAARIEPNFDRLEKAQEYQLLLGEFDRAEAFARDMIEFSQNLSGANDVKTARAYFTLGNVLTVRGRLFDAETAFAKAVEIGAAIPGEVSSDTLIHMARHANSLRKLSSLSGSEEVLRKAENLIKGVGEPDAMAKAAVLEAMAALDREKGQYSEALESQIEATGLLEKTLGQDDIRVVEARSALTALYISLNMPDKAVQNAEAVLAQTKKLVGPHHIYTADRMFDLFFAQNQRKPIEDAPREIREILGLTEKTLGKAHPVYANRLRATGSELLAHGQVELGRSMIQEALILTEAIFGKNNRYYADVLVNLAIAEIAKDHAKAKSMGLEALKIAREIFGDQHPNVAEKLFVLGVALAQGGEIKDAVPLLKEATDIKLAVFGPEDPSYSTYLAIYAQSLNLTGRGKEAFPIAKRAMTIADAANDFPTFAKLIARSIVGSAYFARGQYSEAEFYYRDAIAMADKVSGGHSSVGLHASVSIGGVFAYLGRYEEAIATLTETREEIAKVLGSETNLYALASNNLGFAYNSAGKLDEAEAAYRDALRVLDKTGLVSLNAGIANQNLADILSKADRFEDARPFFERAIEQTEEMNGTQSLEYISSLSNYADALSRHRFHAEAESKARRASELAVAHLEPHLPIYTSARRIMTLVLERREEYDAAMSNQSNLVGVLQSNNLVPRETVEAQLNNLALALKKAGQLDQAISRMRELVSLSRREHDENSLKSLNSRVSNLASLLHERGDWDEAEKYFQEAVEVSIRLKDLAAQANVSNGLADLYFDMHQLEEAERLLKDAIDLSKDASGKPSVSTASHLFWLANYYNRLEQYDKAMRYIDRALDELEYSVGEEHAGYANYLRLKSIMERKLLELAEADASLQEADRINASLHEPNHLSRAQLEATYSSLRLTQGDLTAAKSHARAALDIHTENKVGIDAAQVHLATVLRHSGQLDEAETILRDVLTTNTPRTIAEVERHLGFELQLVEVLLSTGAFNEAIDLSSKVAELANSSLPNGTGLEIYALSLKSRGLTGVGSLIEAEDIGERSLALVKIEPSSKQLNSLRAKKAIASLKFHRKDSDHKSYLAELMDDLKSSVGEKHPEYVNFREAIGVE